METGVGGELDSTNVIDTPEVAVITTIGLDHTAELGPSIQDIAKAKAGIIKQDGDVVLYGGDGEADEVFRKRCLEKGARLHKTCLLYTSQIREKTRRGRFQHENRRNHLVYH